MLELEKTQAGRIQTLLVFVPIVVFFAFQKKLTVPQRYFLGTISVITLATTSYVYLENQKRLK